MTDVSLISTHLRVVGALLVREMATRFGSKPGGYVWALLDPAAHILLMTMIFRAPKGRCRPAPTKTPMTKGYPQPAGRQFPR